MFLLSLYFFVVIFWGAKGGRVGGKCTKIKDIDKETSRKRERILSVPTKKLYLIF